MTVLPVFAEYFRGSKAGKDNYLEWKVTCINEPTVTLILERSTDGRSFSPIHSQTTTAIRCEQGFNYTDITSSARINFYRLKMVTADGVSKYSVIVALLNETKGFEMISVYPNPVENITTLSITSAENGRMDLSITDATGKLLSRQSVNVKAGNNPVTLNLTSFAAGTYFLQLKNRRNELRTISLIKL